MSDARVGQALRCSVCDTPLRVWRRGAVEEAEYQCAECFNWSFLTLYSLHKERRESVPVKHD